MNIALLTNKYFPYGGIPTYVKHLYIGLSKFHNVNNFYLSKSMKERKLTAMYDGICDYQPITIHNGGHTILNNYDILFITSGFTEFDYSFLDDVDIPKKFIVLHDPAEIESNKSIIDVIKKYNFQVITIRSTVKQYLKDKYGIESTFILHPFHIENNKKVDKGSFYSCTARFDWDKHYEIVIKAQKIKRNNIRIYGYVNRMVLFNLKTKYEWDGKEIINPNGFELKELPTILKQSKGLIDMSLFKNDGGGTQYTILEAWDYGVIPILNNGRLKYGGKLKHGINCVGVDNENDLLNAIEDINKGKYDYMIKDFQAFLKEHDCYEIAKLYLSLFE